MRNSTETLIAPQDFWFERLGRLIAPEAQDWQAALMGSYPHADPAKTVRARLGGSEPARFLVTERFAKVWAPVRPEAAVPDHVTFALTSDRKRRQWLVDVILDPPEGVFLAASVGMAAADASHWRLTTTPDVIAFGGAASLFEGENLVLVERARFLAARDWFRDNSATASDLLRYRETMSRFKRGVITGQAARRGLDRLPVEILRTYPGQDKPAVLKLAAFAASQHEDTEEMEEA